MCHFGRFFRTDTLKNIASHLYYIHFFAPLDNQRVTRTIDRDFLNPYLYYSKRDFNVFRHGGREISLSNHIIVPILRRIPQEGECFLTPLSVFYRGFLRIRKLFDQNTIFFPLLDIFPDESLLQSPIIKKTCSAFLKNLFLLKLFFVFLILFLPLYLDRNEKR